MKMDLTNQPDIAFGYIRLCCFGIMLYQKNSYNYK